MKRNIINIGGMIAAGFLCFVLLGVPFPSDAGEVQIDPIMYARAEPPENPTALEIIKKNWCLFHIQQADTYVYRGPRYGANMVGSYTTRINKRGQIRTGCATRGMKNYHGENGVDYKDHIVYWEPEDIKGKSILIFSYIDKTRQEDTWLWLPSLRKIRRVPGSQKEDYHFGTDLSYADLSLRVPSDEDHNLVEVINLDENFIKMAKEKGAVCRVLNWWKDTVSGEELWVIENKQRMGYITYDKRVSYIIKTGKE
ncbi:MAG: outer membrane lipoprotein-sorting protein, partial [Deltaproteobacteria bacterium]|nr:outer membrane lipoprotein-sorting protein [Deltaproteobacteria bacterium]